MNQMARHIEAETSIPTIYSHPICIDPARIINIVSLQSNSPNLEHVITTLQKEQDFSDEFFEKFKLMMNEIVLLNNKKVTILFNELCHICQLKNIDSDSYDIFLKCMPDVKRLFVDRLDDVRKYNDVLYNFQELGEKIVDTNYISSVLKEKVGLIEGLTLEIHNTKNNGKINLFLFNVILNNILSNFKRYGINGKLEVSFSEEGIYISIINDKKDVKFHGTQMGMGIIKKCLLEVGGDVIAEESADKYCMKVKMKYSLQ